MKRCKKKNILLFFLLLLVVVFVIVLSKDRKQEEKQNESEKIDKENEEIIDDSEENIHTQEEEVNYPKPKYVFQEQEIEIQVDGIDREIKVAWICDVHMINDFEASKDVLDEYIETIKSRDEQIFRTKDDIPSRDLWPEIINYINYNQFDGVIFGGDILDYCSEKNAEYMLKYLEKMDKDIPYIYIRSDHDYGFWYGGEGFTEVDAWNLHKEIFPDQDEVEKKVLSYKDFLIVGINKSTNNMEQWYLDWINSNYEFAENTNRKMIIASHAPYASKVDESLSQLSYEIRNKEYFWGGGIYQPNEITSQYLDQIYSESPISKYILAGHMHAGWEGMLTDSVKQYIFAPAYLGNIGIIHFVPTE